MIGIAEMVFGVVMVFSPAITRSPESSKILEPIRLGRQPFRLRANAFELEY
jgi:hypothetical protein